MVMKFSMDGSELPATYKNGTSVINIPEMKVGSGKRIEGLCKCTERITDLSTLKRIDGYSGRILNECYIDLTLDKLRELDDDSEAQNTYICRRSKFMDRGMVNVLMIKIRMPQDASLTDQDYDYVNNLLAWDSNDIYVMPLLEFDDSGDGKMGHPEATLKYEEFVRRMLEELPSWFSSDLTIGMSVPQYYSRRRLEKVLFGEIYKDHDPRFAAIDFRNSRLSKPGSTLKTVLRHYMNEMNAADRRPFFIYGVNVKPYRKGTSKSEAWDIYTAASGFSAVGTTHMKPHPVFAPADEGWAGAGKVYCADEISYLRMENENDHLPLKEWIDDNYGIDIRDGSPGIAGRAYPYLRRFNFEKANGTLERLTVASKEGDIREIDGVLDKRPEELVRPLVDEGYRG